MPATAIDSSYVLPASGGVAAHAGVAADTVNGNSFINDGKIILVVVSTDAAPQNLTVDIPDTLNVDGQVVPSKVISIPAGATRYFRFPAAQYGKTVTVTAATATLALWLIR